MNLPVPVRPTWLQAISRKIRRFPAKMGYLLVGKGSRWLYRRLGVQFLDKPQTAALLAPNERSTYPANRFSLSQVADLANPSKIYFKPTQDESEPVSVWVVGNADGAFWQLPYGSVRDSRHVLCTDINTDDFYRNVLHRTSRKQRNTKTLLAPWSHYLDGVVWGGYFDFVLLVLGKLCRMKEVLSAAEFNDALVAYPLFDTPYEREFLWLLGISVDRVVDSRKTHVQFEQCVLANTGHWFYPNKADIDALRRQIMPKLPAPVGKRNRVYISRVGRRRVINESALIELLRSYDIEIIEDKPRTVAEQIAIYQNAEFIIGPHGASFVNIIWCQPGTHLFELFAPTYYPDFYRNMAEQLGLQYSAYFYGPAGTGDWAKGLEDDIYVSVDELEQCLRKVFVNTLPLEN
ncbi:glycosyltransferase family 61 protein [Fibrella sp. HMF5335]|uniref:Glycosyltransferase family 61 protein n=1 Tax=Fibrella rubiginis TaxID=2817060 RepID=A0A939GM47_9BACT|nr:glycosyltransferase family 61 protein [Fibrella rubiginis]MBO0939345.1 glycosyltransferase family 61 protein [Fibrella rubiginis]